MKYNRTDCKSKTCSLLLTCLTRHKSGLSCFGFHTQPLLTAVILYNSESTLGVTKKTCLSFPRRVLAPSEQGKGMLVAE